ncbi:MAG: Gldg family protein [Oscillospiraceae bacterium]|nr:Gldg family protein [Oscillospiraceae bacterium]
MTSILKRDFKAYFTSPIGYIYIGSYIFVLNLVFYLNNALGNSASVSGVFGFMLLVMMFTTPILTMRVFSEEYKMKTDLLLLTTPVRTFDIVSGKFLSAQLVFVTLLALTLTWPAIISAFASNNVAEVIGNYAGMFFIGAAYIAMGIFISSLTENQVVAAVGSLGMFIGLYLLDVIHSFFYSNGAFPLWFMNALGSISVFGRYGSINSGILALDDVVFFISLTLLFLFLTARRWDRQRGFSIAITAIFIVGVVLVNIAATQLTTRFYLKADLSEQKFYTLSEQTIDVLRGIGEDVTITVLDKEAEWQNPEDLRYRLMETLNMYSSYSGGRVKVNYIDPDLNPRIKEQYPALTDVVSGDIIVESARRYTSVNAGNLFLWSYNNRNQPAPVAMDAEQKLTSALLYTLSDVTARAVFLEGHNESPTTALQALFETSNYEVETINLAHNDLPADTTVVICAAPKSDLLPLEMERLEAYMNSGGNTMIFYDMDTPKLPNLDLYIEEWGVSVSSELVLDPTYNFGYLYAIGAAVLAPEKLPSAESLDTVNKMAVMGGARPLTPLWPTGEREWRTSEPLVASWSTSYSKSFDSDNATAEKSPGDKEGPFILAMLTTDRGNVNLNPVTSRMLVSSYCLIDDTALGNSQYFINAQLLGVIANDFNPSGESVIIPVKVLAGSSMSIMSGQVRVIFFALVIAMPLIIFVAGGFVWRKRRSL